MFAHKRQIFMPSLGGGDSRHCGKVRSAASVSSPVVRCNGSLGILPGDQGDVGHAGQAARPNQSAIPHRR